MQCHYTHTHNNIMHTLAWRTVEATRLVAAGGSDRGLALTHRGVVHELARARMHDVVHLQAGTVVCGVCSRA